MNPEHLRQNKKVSITLDDRDAELLTKAILVAKPHMKLDPAEFQGLRYARSRNFVVRWMIRSLAAAILKAGQMPLPLAVEMRFETKEEMVARCGHDPLAAYEAGSQTQPPSYPETWIMLGDVEAAAAREFSTRYRSMSATMAARWLLAYACAHPAQVEAWVHKLMSYCRAEDLASHEIVQSAITSATNAAAAARRDEENEEKDGEGWKSA